MFVGLSYEAKRCILEPFGAFWSNVGLMMDCICLELCGWTKLKIK